MCTKLTDDGIIKKTIFRDFKWLKTTFINEADGLSIDSMTQTNGVFSDFYFYLLWAISLQIKYIIEKCIM